MFSRIWCIFLIIPHVVQHTYVYQPSLSDKLGDEQFVFIPAGGTADAIFAERDNEVTANCLELN